MSLFRFIICAMQSGHLQDEHLTEPEFRQLFHQQIDALDLETAKTYVSRFVKDVEVLKIWSQDYFHELARRMQLTAG